ncbi:F/Y rich C-terminus-domain-containing protein [Mycena amicta]|nr:F/Y rich C-terminus-domain-containing protein [Mycena amicta]
MPQQVLPPQASTSQRPATEAPRPTKPKRLKAHTVTSKSYSIPMVPRDKTGKPMLPLNVGIMTVISLGDVCMREHFHTERYIFPVGYEVTRRYLSTVDRNAEVVYHCTILDGGDGPKFQIIPSDVPDRPVIAGTATGAWSSIVKQANSLRQRQHSNSVSGPDFFGLGQNTIKHLIQELPNADRLRDYVWQHFVEGGPLGGRHAAVIPALPEEYKSATPIGSYYPPRIPGSEPEEVVDAPKNHYPLHRPPQDDGPKFSHYPAHLMEQAPHPSGDAIPAEDSAGSVNTNYYLAHPENEVTGVPPPVAGNAFLDTLPAQTIGNAGTAQLEDGPGP